MPREASSLTPWTIVSARGLYGSGKGIVGSAQDTPNSPETMRIPAYVDYVRTESYNYWETVSSATAFLK